MSDSSNICIACGLCCDGSIIGYVQIGNDELEVTREIMDIEEANGEGFFFHPCEKLSCDGCTVYNQRPKKCISFKCKILNSIEDKEISLDSALEIVKHIKIEKKKIQEKIDQEKFQLQSESFYFQMLELKKVINKLDTPLTAGIQEIVTDLEKLNQLLSKTFGLTF